MNIEEQQMPWYQTECRVGSSNYGGQLYAANDEQAHEIAARRGIGETVDSVGGKGIRFTRPSEWMRKPPLHENDLHTFHSLCWFAHLALKSGTATADELFGDRGVVHEWAHLRALGEEGLGTGMSVDRLIQMVEDIEQRIPGFLGSGDPDEFGELIDIDEAIRRTALDAAVAWFDDHHATWGPGALPEWYTHAKCAKRKE